MKKKAKTTKFMKIKPIGDKQLLVLHNSKLFRFKENTVLKID